jgi:hypothetical protein
MTDIKQKFSFSNSFPNSGTTVKYDYDIIFNTPVDYFGYVDVKSMDFLITLKSTVSSLYCLAQASSHSVNLKKVILENVDLKMTFSNTYSLATFSDFKDAFAPPRFMDESSMKESIDSAIKMFETFNQGNDKITIKNTEGFKIDAGEGKDIVVGNKGDDTIIGGAGSDKLTGGKGADTFSFDLIDFFDLNDDAKVVYNNVVDTITDFNLKEHDVLNFGDVSRLDFYTTLNEAKLDNAFVFYIKGSGNIYLNMGLLENEFTPHVIIKLTGKPAVNGDLTDWNYPES